MKCPKCDSTEGLKWMLRAQHEDDSTAANVITMLCTKCGHNASVFIEDYIEDIFPDWREIDMSWMDNVDDIIVQEIEDVPREEEEEECE